jgi:hypothetical protein
VAEASDQVFLRDIEIAIGMAFAQRLFHGGGGALFPAR